MTESPKWQCAICGAKRSEYLRDTHLKGHVYEGDCDPEEAMQLGLSWESWERGVAEGMKEGVVTVEALRRAERLERDMDAGRITQEDCREALAELQGILNDLRADRITEEEAWQQLERPPDNEE